MYPSLKNIFTTFLLNFLGFLPTIISRHFYTKNWRQTKMDYMQYSQDFQINAYFNALPPYVRQIILQAFGEITTLGELKECADHIMNSGLY